MRWTSRSIAAVAVMSMGSALGPSAISAEPGAPSPRPEILVDQRATGGSGTEGDPWIGWESALASDATARFRAGWYRLGVSLSIPRGATLSGEGEASVVLFGAPDIGIANAPDAGDIGIERVRILGAASEHGRSTTSCIQLSAGTAARFRIENVTVEDAGQDGILVVGAKGRATDVKIRGCKVSGARRHGIELRTVRNGRVEENTVRSTNRGDLGAAIYAGSDVDTDNVVVVGNEIEGVGDNGIRSAGSHVTIERNRVTDVHTDGIRLAGDRQICRDNTVTKAMEQGIKVEDGSIVTVERNAVSESGQNGIEVRFTHRQPNRIRIVSNTASRNGNSGLFLFGAERVTADGNHFLENAQNGIKVYVDPGRRVRNVTLVRNELRAVAGSTAPSGDEPYDGILVGGAGDIGAVVIRDNVIDGRSSWRHGIHVARGSSVRLFRNDIRDTSGEATAQPAPKGTR